MQGSHFFIGDLYPNMFPASTRKATIPEGGEQKHYTGNDNPVTVAPAARQNIWLGVGVVLLIVYLLNR